MPTILNSPEVSSVHTALGPHLPDSSVAALAVIAKSDSGFWKPNHDGIEPAVSIAATTTAAVFFNILFMFILP